MKSKNLMTAMLALLVVTTSVFADGLTRTPWEMNRGRDVIYLDNWLGTHGNSAAYDSASIPDVADADWEDAPSAVNIGFSETSIIPSGECLWAVDFTYFQTFVTVPTGTTVDTFTIEFSGIDDGGRVTLFNDTYPAGLVIPGSYIYLGDTETANLAAYVAEGVNRVVVTQMDDCPDGNNLQSAVVVLNGESVDVPATEQTFTILGANGTIGTQDPYIQALIEGSTTWTQAYLTGPHIWGEVPGTNSWLNFDPDPEVGINTSTPYRIRFMVPPDYTNPSMTFQVKADNLGIIYINDTYIDSVEGEGTPSVPDATIEQALHVGLNEIRITMVDWGGVVGLNYRIDVTMTSAEDLSDAVLTPEDAAEHNNPPVADAGNDMYVEGNEVTLDASGSSDPDGNLLTYEWFIDEGELIATGVNPTVTLPNGYHEIGLKVSDGELYDWDWIEIEVDGEPMPPDLVVILKPKFGSENVNRSPDRVIFDLSVKNHSSWPTSFTLKFVAKDMQTGKKYQRLMGTPVNIWLGPGERLVETLTQFVPGWIEPGYYHYRAVVGKFPFGVVDIDGFTITKSMPEGPLSYGGEGSEEDWVGFYYDLDVPVQADDLWKTGGKYRADGSNIGSATSVENDTKPVSFTLNQNYPNPFNPSTTIGYGLPEDAHVSLVIYDVRGKVVQTLKSEPQNAGWHNVVWNGETADGKSISTGIYFAKLVAGDYSHVIKMLYSK